MSSYVSWAGVVAMIIVAFIGGKYGLAGQRQQSKTQKDAAKIQARTEEGRLALDMAVETRDRLDMLEDWEDRVSEWWNSEHRPIDEARDEALLRHAPKRVWAKIPPSPPMPRPKRTRN